MSIYESVVAGSADEQRPVHRRTIDEQRALMVDGVAPLRPFGNSLLKASGLTLFEDIVSDLDLPMLTVTKVAGWGVRASNLVGASAHHPIDLSYVGASHAGGRMAPPLVSGCTIYLAAGVPIPAGVDAVVPEADATHVGDEVRFHAEIELDANLKLKGSDLSDGEPLLSAGEVLTPRSVAVLAEIGLDKVLVRPRPRLVVMSANSVNVQPGEAITSPEQRYDSGTAFITAAASATGAEVYSAGVVSPSPSRLRSAITGQVNRADVIVIVGGSEEDVASTIDVIDGLGGIDLAELTVNTGVVYGFGRASEGGVPIVLLPAGALSTFVGYYAFVAPMLARFEDGNPSMPLPYCQAQLASDVPSERGRAEIVPALLEDGVVRPVAGGASEMAVNLYRANALLLVPENRAALLAGEQVECVMLNDLDSATHVA